MKFPRGELGYKHVRVYIHIYIYVHGCMYVCRPWRAYRREKPVDAKD